MCHAGFVRPSNGSANSLAHPTQGTRAAFIVVAGTKWVAQPHLIPGREIGKPCAKTYATPVRRLRSRLAARGPVIDSPSRVTRIPGRDDAEKKPTTERNVLPW